MTEIQVQSDSAMAALSFIKESEPVSWLAARDDLSRQTRIASEYLFSLSSEYATSCPLKQLLTKNFDAEQIWQQIDLQSGPILGSVKRNLRQIQRNDVVLLQGNDDNKIQKDNGSEHVNGLVEERQKDNDESEDESDEEIKEADEDDGDSEEEADIDEDDDEKEGEEDDEGHPVEDKFFKLKDMEKFIDQAEAQEDDASVFDEEEEDDEEDDGENESDEEDDDSENLQDEEMEDDEEKDEEDLKYDDFFGGRSKKKTENKDESDSPPDQPERLSKHEKERAKVQKHIEQLEKANLESSTWTMQGEVSAAKRPKNSALEVELDFEHNARPPPVITEEVTASLEDLIRKRITENNFDDVQRKASAPVSAPQEQIELDESKSKKGLAEVYEADYMQKSGLAPVSSSPADDIRKEATTLFKALCVKLDALSHFHFTPKPVIEDMEVRQGVPALAMEEVAPLMTSDAQMLAPEEVFEGQGIVKAEAELTRSERKRRRANKKEKRKAAKKRNLMDKNPDAEKLKEIKASSLQGNQKTQRSKFVKSTKVFEQLDQNVIGNKKESQHTKDVSVPSLKL